MEQKEIYVTAFPRSGNTWLNRLLADVLNSPMQTQPNAVVNWASEGRDGDYVLRKAHKLGYEKTDGKWIFIQRDPRDVAVSAMYYSKSPSLLETLMTLLCRCEPWKPGIFRKVGVYERWVRSWLDTGLADVVTKYEILHADPVHELSRIVSVLTGLSLDMDWIRECVQRQSFDVVAKSRKGDLAMRKGIVGDWRNHFTRPEGHLLNDYLGEFMYEQRYIEKFDWWVNLPMERT